MEIVVAVTFLAVLTAGVAYGDVIGYPWSTWGVTSYTPNGNVDKGAILST